MCFALPLLDPTLGLDFRDRQDKTVRGLATGIIALLLVYCLIVVLLVRMVWRMGRVTTQPVGALRQATEALSAGRLDYRIAIAGEDELWTVARSFNSMAERLVRMRDVERHAQRIEEELRLARDIQNRLLPAEPPQTPGLELAGLSIPALEVGGDYFDYLMFPQGCVGLVVADVSGKGIPAALLMSAFGAALSAAR